MDQLQTVCLHMIHIPVIKLLSFLCGNIIMKAHICVRANGDLHKVSVMPLASK